MNELNKKIEQEIALAEELSRLLLHSSEALESSSQGHYQVAIEQYNKLLVVARKTSNKQFELQALAGLGSSYAAVEDFLEAINYSEEALSLAEEFHDEFAKFRLLSNLSSIYFSLGDFSSTIDKATKLLEISKKIDDKKMEASAHSYLAGAHFSYGESEKAIQHYKQGLELIRTSGDTYRIALSLSSLAEAYIENKNYEDAKVCLAEVWQIAQQTNNLALSKIVLESLGTLCLIFKHYDQAIENFLLAVSLQTESYIEQGISLNNLGFTYYKAGELKKAEETLYKAIEIWESRYKKVSKNELYSISIFDTQLFSYHILQKVLIEQENFDRALEVAEKSRGRTFIAQLIAKSQIISSNSTPFFTIDQAKTIARTNKFNLIVYSLISDKERYFVSGKSENRSANLFSDLFIWLIKDSGQIIFRQVDISNEDKKFLLEQLTIKVSSHNTRNFDLENSDQLKPNLLAELYQLLITPVEGDLPETGHLVFLPQDQLFFTPFAALVDTQGNYLIERYSVSLAYSIESLALIRQEKATDYLSSALIVGNPSAANLSQTLTKKLELQSLPYAEQEAKEIANLLTTEALIAERATKEAVVTLLPKHKVIHLATHGELSKFSEADIPGLIMLSDGWLKASDILKIRLNAELVVLSACWTSKGRLTSDGIVGLLRTFLMAGASTVISTLWAVRDEPTKILMVEFYKQLQQSVTKAEALRQAMIATMQYPQFHDPYCWAAFTIIGKVD
ncbi:MAG: CHAT domain-containing protein [Blastocatellia bacterium]|nr:CHAT domain-containing protein [Blastocatellia bacterium]